MGYFQWLVASLFFIISCLIVTRYIIPQILEQINSSFRFSSISPRSIRGLVIRRGNTTISVARIGISFHAPSVAGAKHVHIQIQGLVITVSKPSALTPVPNIRLPRPKKANRSRYSVSNFDIAPPLAMLAGFIPSRHLWKLDALLRPVLRSLFVRFMRLLIWILPSLSQIIDLELDHAVVMFEALGGAHISLKGATLATKVELVQVTNKDSPKHDALVDERIRRLKRLYRVTAGWRDRLAGSAQRVLARALGRTNGYVSFVLKLDELMVLSGPPNLPHRPRRSSGSSMFIPRPQTPSSWSRVDTEDAPLAPSIPGAILSMPSPARLKLAVKFSPVALRRSSLIVSTSIPVIDISIDPLLDLKTRIKTMLPRPQPPPLNTQSPLSPLTPALSPGPLSALDSGFIPSTPMGMLNETHDPSFDSTFETQDHSRPLLARILKSFEFRTQSIRISHTTPFGGAENRIPFATIIHKFFFKGYRSVADENEMHRKWLGRTLRPNSKLDADVLALSSGMTGLTVQRLLDPESSIPVSAKILRIGQSGVDVLATQCLPGWLPKAKCFGDDSNAAFVACEVRVDGIHLTERLDLVQRVLAHSRNKNTHHDSSPTSLLPTALMSQFTPRIAFDCVVTEARMSLMHTKVFSDSPPPFSIDVGLDQWNIHLSTVFHERVFASENGESVQSRDAKLAKAVPLGLVYRGDTHFGPVTARLSFDAGSEEDIVVSDEASDTWEDLLDPASHSASTFSSHLSETDATDPIIILGPSEFQLLGQVAGEPLNGGEYLFQTKDAISELKCRVDELTVDLRDPIVLPTILHLTTAFLKDSTPRLPPRDALTMSSFPTGLCVYMWLGSAQVGMANLDINPNIPPGLPVSRGLALSTACVVQYGSLIAPRHTSLSKMDRSPFNLAPAAMRSRLQLMDDISYEASALARDAFAREGRESAVVLNMRLLGLRCWALTMRGGRGSDFPYLEDEVDRLEGRTHVDHRVLFDIPRLATRAVLRLIHESTSNVQIMGDAHRIYWRFSLEHAYSLLLLLHRLKPLRRRRSYAPPASSSVFLFTYDLRIHDIQGFCAFPSGQRLYIRCKETKVNGSPRVLPRIEGHSLMVWVPSAQPKLGDKWEELGRMNSWKVSLDEPFPNPYFRIAAGGVRIRIPYHYVLSNLITNATLAVKATKHLWTCLVEGTFTEMGQPLPEPPKHVPRIHFAFDFLSLEAADDEFESRLNLIWRTGLDEQRAREERLLAFDAKVAAIKQASLGREDLPGSKAAFEWHFDARHTVDPSQAFQRLQHYTSDSWIRRFPAAQAAQIRREENILQKLQQDTGVPKERWSTIDTHSTGRVVPLVRLALSQVTVDISPPSFTDNEGMKDFMYDLGSGLPRTTSFTLLVPLHLKWSADSIRVSIRDYPLPIIFIPPSTDPMEKSWVFETDLVVAEEFGPTSSVMFASCVITDADDRNYTPEFSVSIPKSTMPVKTYADVSITVSSGEVADFAWGVSFTPAIPDIMRVFDSITPPQRDPSPPIGFWDKLRLIMHWRLKAQFATDVNLHLKGSRDPYMLSGPGAGFVMEWRGRPTFTVGHSAVDQELLQLQSDSMILAIPDLKRFEDIAAVGSIIPDTLKPSHSNRRYIKAVAKFHDGIRMGMGFIFARLDRQTTLSSPAQLFGFVPHYHVALRAYDDDSDRDSYHAFRSDHIHYSISLQSLSSSSRLTPNSDGSIAQNTIHLAPKMFAHFWAWWGLFNGALSLPIRQGSLFPAGRPPTPKFSRHLATIKYRISLNPLLLCHVYHQESRAGWQEGQTTCVGVKLKVDKFQADLHQREESTMVTDPASGRTRTIRRKAFYSSEVVFINSELRAIRAVFAEPQKALFSVPLDHDDSGFDRPSLPTTEPEPLSSPWVDIDDYIETDWNPTDETPRVWLIPCGFCPRFTYLKTVPSAPRSSYDPWSPFGQEDTHRCLQGREKSVQQIQVQFAEERLKVLRGELVDLKDTIARLSPELSSSGHSQPIDAERVHDLSKRIRLLEEYIIQLHIANPSQMDDAHRGPYSSVSERSYYMPVDDPVFPESWEEFGNVYQVHSPKVVLSNTTRDILLDYYYSSRYRRGFEYHMATRAVKFIRESTNPSTHAPAYSAKDVGVAATRAAGKVLRRLVAGHHEHNEKRQRHSISQTFRNVEPDTTIHEDPIHGWSDEITSRKGHFCLILRPQIALRSEVDSDANLILVASSASLHNHSILDPSHLEDAIHGLIMQRNYVKLAGLQIFSPTSSERKNQYRAPDDIPLEVLVDYRCEHRGFTRLVPQTEATLQYDKFNRLRLRDGKIGQTASTTLEASGHLRSATDRVLVNIPRFSVSANSDDFASVANVVTNLLLYSDPTQKRRNEELEKFIYRYDFSDRQDASKVVANLQRHLRQLQQSLSNYQANFDLLDEGGRLDMLSIKSQFFSLANELNLIFESIAHAQAKAEGNDSQQAFGVRVDASSSEISWNMLEDNNLLAKLSIRGTRYSWLTAMDGSMMTSLSMTDVQALDGSPNALFSEMLVKHEAPGATGPLFAQLDWSTLPAVGGISIIRRLHLQLHPIRLQIEQQTGRRILKYVFGTDSGDDDSGDILSHNPSNHPLRSSIDSGAPSTSSHTSATDIPRPRPIKRASSYQNLRSTAATPTNNNAAGGLQPHQPRKLRKSPSSDVLRARPQTADNPKAAVALVKKAVDADVEEMRRRASRNRTFLNIQVSSLVCVLSYKRDTPLTLRSMPDLDNFKFKTPSFEYRNEIWTVEEVVNALKRDVYKAAWQQKGALLRELALKAKFVTPRKFTAIGGNTTPSAGPSGANTPTSVTSQHHRRRWPHVFHRRGSSPSRPELPEPPVTVLGGDEPLVSSPTSESFPSSDHTSLSEETTTTPPEQPEATGRPRKLSFFSRPRKLSRGVSGLERPP